ncbi:unnamed protein product [Rhizopus stolonifer]
MDFINYIPEKFDSYTYESSSEMEVEDEAHEYGNIEKLVEFGSQVPETQVVEMEVVDVSEITAKVEAVSLVDEKKKKKYGPDQIQHFFFLMREEGMPVAKAAEKCMIPRSTAYKLLKEYNEGPGSVLPGTRSKGLNRGTPPKFIPEHTTFLIKYFDEQKATTLKLARAELIKEFPDLIISLSALWKHITETCFFSLKQASKYNMDRDTDRTLRLRYEIISK